MPSPASTTLDFPDPGAIGMQLCQVSLFILSGNPPAPACSLAKENGRLSGITALIRPVCNTAYLPAPTKDRPIISQHHEKNTTIP